MNKIKYEYIEREIEKVKKEADEFEKENKKNEFQ
jgi:hypothetical protein